MLALIRIRTEGDYKPLYSIALRVAAVVAFVLVLGTAGAQDRTPVKPGEPGPLEAYAKTGESETCIHAIRIRRTEVIDGQTILFHLGRDHIYMNRLPRWCPGLARERAFSYTIRGSQLCNVDIIRVLEKPIMRTGATCGLGRFERLALRPEYEDDDLDFEFEIEDEPEED